MSVPCSLTWELSVAEVRGQSGTIRHDCGSNCRSRNDAFHSGSSTNQLSFVTLSSVEAACLTATLHPNELMGR